MHNHFPLRVPFTALLLSLASAACGGNVESGAGGGTTTGSTSTTTSTSATTTSSSTTSTPTGPGDCTPGGSSTLAGVRIEFPSSGCTFSYADPVVTIAIPYEVVVDQDVAGVTPAPQDAGGCGQPGPSGLITFEEVSGGGQGYCLCDTGLCAPTSTTVTLKKGVYPGTFEWDRHNWSGPSDTGNPKGPLFPAGDYTLTISAEGMVSTPDSEQPFVVTGTLPIHLVP